jgi:DNA-binding transcriptional LysR family regulator
MEFHQLRYFCAIATYGTFTRAAKSEHVAQPSLSQQILKLEDELGGKLFYRLPRAARLTPLGEFFLPHALAILQEIRTSKAGARKVIAAATSELVRNTPLMAVNQAPPGVEPSPSTDSKTGLRAFRKGA